MPPIAPLGAGIRIASRCKIYNFMIEYFNGYYFLYLFVAVGLVISLYILLRNKSKRTASIVLLSILLASFALHFLKLAFGYYQERMPWAIRTITPENICAVSVLVFPWFFLSKKAVLKDYMFYLGVISGIGATVIPIDVIGLDAFEFETIRYYFSHIIIWIVPILMVLLKVHTLDYKRILKVPFIAYLVLCLILINEVLLTSVGLLEPWYLFSDEIRNAALIFGPNPEIAFIGNLFLPLTPEFFTVIPIGANAGRALYWPIIWLMIPGFVYLVAVCILLALPFEYKNMRKDIKKLVLTLIEKCGGK